MAEAFFLRLKTLRLPALLAAAKHNGREIAAELGADSHIDATRSHRNTRLTGPDDAKGVVDRWHELLAQAGARLHRRDAAACIEAVFSVPASSQIDPVAYFSACTDWIGRNLGCPVLASDIHLDEDHPHCHVLLMPLKDGRLQGSSIMGDRAVVTKRNDAFGREVAGQHGLSWGTPRLKGRQKRQGAAASIRELQQRDDPALRSAAWGAIRALIEDDPETVMQALGIELDATTERKQRTFAGIMTSPGKGARWEPDFVPQFCTPGPR